MLRVCASKIPTPRPFGTLATRRVPRSASSATTARNVWSGFSAIRASSHARSRCSRSCRHPPICLAAALPPAPALRPLHDTGHAHSEQRRRPPTGATARHRTDHPSPQVLRTGSCHPLLAPRPSQHLQSQILKYTGIPLLIQPLASCSRSSRVSNAADAASTLSSVVTASAAGNMPDFANRVLCALFASAQPPYP